jgi:hypothetical protein
MAAPKNESQLTGQIQKAIQTAYPDSFNFKVHGGPYQLAGMPDLVACVKGLFIGLEIKHQKPGESETHARGRVTTIQTIMLDKVKKAGGASSVVLSAAEALEVIGDALFKANLVD